MMYPIAFQVTVDKDILYYSQVMKETDRKQFQKAMKREFDAHSESKNWDVVSINDVPEGEKVLDSVWAIRRKRHILTNEVYTHKAMLNIHGWQ